MLQSVPPLSQGVQSTDEGVQFTLPSHSFGLNLVVLWRDDIPSRPVPVWNLAYDLTEEDAIASLLQGAIEQICRFLPQDVAVQALEPGAWLPCVVSRAQGALDNVVDYIFRQTSPPAGFALRFWFDITRSQNPYTFESSSELPAASTPAGWDDFLSPSNLGSAKKVAFRFKPPWAANEGDALIAVQLMARISLPGAPRPLSLRIGPRIQVTQKHLDIPTVAIFFTGEQCLRRPLIVFPATQKLLDAGNGRRQFHWDVRGLFDPSTGRYDDSRDGFGLRKLADLRRNILGKVLTVSQTLDVIKGFLGNVSWISEADLVANWIGAAAEFCVDTTGLLPDLRESIYYFDSFHNENWCNTIEYAVLIGPPGSSVTFECRRVLYDPATANQVDVLKLSLNGNDVIAGVDLRHFSAAGIPLAHTVPSSGNWGGCIASIVVRE